MDGKLIGIISFVIFLVAMLFFLLGFGSPWWYEVEGGGASSSFGLFMGCGKAGDSGWECESYELDLAPDMHKATVAMCCLALVVFVAGLICYILTLCKDLSLTIGAVLCGVAGLFTLIGVSIFGAEYFKDSTEFIGWSFALACTSCAIAIANLIVTLILNCVCN